MTMENFFNWMSKPVPLDEVEVWFNMHNMSYEKIELFGDFFKSLYKIMSNTYLGQTWYSLSSPFLIITERGDAVMPASVIPAHAMINGGPLTREALA